ncbi:MAG: VCBS repeat-containing protein [Bradyrhizobium sp.]|nr:VCBS repeat-containing protein [Pseudomonadota bacterium]MDE2471409.1 VCBS repeat-containing protein [Bradyrhizobium sp.]
MSISGNFAVSPTGAATYSIPIALPPGTAGMTPTLSLEYNSQGGNGLLGIGWSLAGLPTVTRCPQTLAQDGVTGGINFDSNDRFCLDGQRLVAVTGTYGADGTEYRTEVETFSKILSHGSSGSGPAWFEVHTKSGQVMQFGNTTDSRILAQGKSSARIWTVNRVADTKGNYYTVSYVNDLTPYGQFYPVEIDYGGNSVAGTQPYNSVKLNYETRPDSTPLYQAGSLTQTNVRPTDITAYAGSSAVVGYRLYYTQSQTSGRSQIYSIKACNQDSGCLPTTNFQWTGSSVAFSQQGQLNPNSWDFGTPPSALRLPISGDFNGDGISDIVLVSNDGYYVMFGNGDTTFRDGGVFPMPNNWNFGNPPTAQYTPFTGDFNGDGKADFALLCDKYSYVFLSNGDGTFSGVAQAYSGGSNFGNPPSANFTPFSGDFNGDGRTDIVFINGANYWTFLSNGDGTFSETGGPHPNNWNFGSNAPVSYLGHMMAIAPQSTTSQYVSFAGDVDGDGKTDLVLFCDKYYYVLLSNGDGSFRGAGGLAFAGGSNFGLPPTTSYAPFVGDLNGDGKADFAILGGNNYWSFLSKGDGTFTESGGPIPNGWNFGYPPTSGYVTLTGDANGDGKSDLYILGPQGYVFLLSNGDGSFSPGFGGSYPNSSTNLSTPPSTQWSVLAGDFMGNGRTSVALMRDASNGVLYVPGSAWDVISSVTNGIGATTSITYQPLTNASVYTKDTNSAYPTQDLQGPIYVVSRVDNSNGVGGVYSASYSYAGAKADMSGRGFLGFRQMAVKDLQTSIVDTTNYAQTFPYIGLVSSTMRAFGSQTLGQSSNTYQFSNASGGTVINPFSAPYRVSLSQNVSSGSDLDGSALPMVTTSNQYDAYNNATQVVVSTPDGFSKTTTNTYANDVTNWYLGRLTRATVANVAP